MFLKVPLNLSEIRPFQDQVFEGLKELEVVHTDLKLDNVVLVNQKYYPFKVKLIDFSVAYLKSELKQGMRVQPNAFQAPEVSLGLPLSEAMDMWSLGCILVDLYLVFHPFFGTPYENQMIISDTLGFAPKEILSQEDSQWRLKTPDKNQKETGLESLKSLGPLQGYDLDQAIQSFPPINRNPEFRDRLNFVSLCECLLHLDHRKRITPSAALCHPFITMEFPLKKLLVN
uniref:Protein kinase domain-containing protein n=1 Tax=Periophthalmus magnuspinnatus TaxID=409849 RepID=A0A3B4ASS6_9GOBI